MRSKCALNGCSKVAEMEASAQEEVASEFWGSLRTNRAFSLSPSGGKLLLMVHKDVILTNGHQPLIVRKGSTAL